jgi:hypothetical protein
MWLPVELKDRKGLSRRACSGGTCTCGGTCGCGGPKPSDTNAPLGSLDAYVVMDDINVVSSPAPKLD